MFANDESNLSKQLQLILDVLMRVRDPSKVIISLLAIFSEHLPYDFNAEITKSICLTCI